MLLNKKICTEITEMYTAQTNENQMHLNIKHKSSSAMLIYIKPALQK